MEVSVFPFPIIVSNWLIIGVDRAAMCVALSALQEEGLISYEKNRFTLHINAAEGQ